MGKSNSVNITFPAGKAIWPYLHEPSENFNKDGYEYRTGLVLPAEQAEPIISQLEAAMEQNLAEVRLDPKNKRAKMANHRPWRDEEDDNGDPTGNVIFSFKLKAQVTRKSDGKTFDMRPGLFDAKGKPVPGTPVGGGSRIKVAAEVRGYYVASQGAGITLNLRGVQILELVKFGGKSAADMGFSAEEGFTGEDDGTFEGGADSSDGDNSGDY